LLYSPLTNDKINVFINIIKNHYSLDDYITERIVFTYHTWSKTKKTKSIIHLSTKSDVYLLRNRTINPEEGPRRPLTIDDLVLHVQYVKGDFKEKDVNCNSQFMNNVMDEIGTSIRRDMTHVPNSEPIYLFMDNAGGHGKENVKDNYKKHLLEKYKIKILWQVPNSPETNLLDLGVWMGIQNSVEDVHRQHRLDEDVLAKSVVDAFWQFPSEKITNIYKRWFKVLDLMVLNNGGNELIECNRGPNKSSNPLPSMTYADDFTDESYYIKFENHEEEDANHNPNQPVPV